VVDPNARKIKIKTALNKELGLDESKPVEYEKYEPLTLEAFHEGRRRWLMKFEDQATFDDWAEMFKVCAKLCESGVLDEPIAKSAFAEAFLEQKRQCRGPTNAEYGGSEADQLTQLVGRCIGCRMLGMLNVRCALVYSALSAQVYGRNRLSRSAQGQEDDVRQGPRALSNHHWGVDSRELAAIAQGLQCSEGCCDKGGHQGVRACMHAWDPIPRTDGLHACSLGPVIKARSGLVTKATDQLSGKMEPVKTKMLAPLAEVIAKAVGPSTLASLALTKPVYQVSCTSSDISISTLITIALRSMSRRTQSKRKPAVI
jgi:hypothetical protein